MESKAMADPGGQDSYFPCFWEMPVIEYAPVWENVSAWRNAPVWGIPVLGECPCFGGVSLFWGNAPVFKYAPFEWGKLPCLGEYPLSLDCYTLGWPLHTVRVSLDERLTGRLGGLLATLTSSGGFPDLLLLGVACCPPLLKLGVVCCGC